MWSHRASRSRSISAGAVELPATTRISSLDCASWSALVGSALRMLQRTTLAPTPSIRLQQLSGGELEQTFVSQSVWQFTCTQARILSMIGESTAAPGAEEPSSAASAETKDAEIARKRVRAHWAD